MKNGTRRIAGSRNRFCRNGLMASGRSGPPRLNRTIATLRRRSGTGVQTGSPPVTGMASAMTVDDGLSPAITLKRSSFINPLTGTHDLQQGRDILGRSLRHDPVPEVEDTWAPAHGVQD